MALMGLCFIRRSPTLCAKVDLHTPVGVIGVFQALLEILRAFLEIVSIYEATTYLYHLARTCILIFSFHPPFPSKEQLQFL